MSSNARTENFGVPWEESYGYVQAIKPGYESQVDPHDRPPGRRAGDLLEAG
jgi:hypothetical protein